MVLAHVERIPDNGFVGVIPSWDNIWGITGHDSAGREVFSLRERSEVILAIENCWFIRERIRRGKKLSQGSEWSRCSEPNCQLLASYGKYCSGHTPFGGPECDGGAQVGHPEPEARLRLADVPIEDLDLSAGALSRLKSCQITSLGQLVALPERDISDHVDRESLDEIKTKLVQRGFVTPEELTYVLDRCGL